MRCAACRRGGSGPFFTRVDLPARDDAVVLVQVDGATLPLCPSGDCEAALDAALVDTTDIEPWPPAVRAAAPAPRHHPHRS